MRTADPRFWRDLGLAVVFGLAIGVPAVLYLIGGARVDVAFLRTVEERAPFVLPPVTSGALAVGGYQRDAERVFEQAFPGRSALIEGYDGAVFALGGEASPLVIRGRDGWLFYGAEERDELTGAASLDDAALARLVTIFRARSDWSAAHGARYLLLIVPNKSTIYSEKLPPQIRPVRPTILDRLLPRLQAAGIEAPDLRPALIALAARTDAYARGDTHWTNAGAYVADRAIAARLAPAGVALRVVPGEIRLELRAAPGDLYKLSGVGTAVVDREAAFVYPHAAQAIADPAIEQASARAGFQSAVTVVGDPRLPTAVVLGDSFSAALQPLLAENFRRAVFLGYDAAATAAFAPGIVASERPTVVIQEFVERRLALPIEP